jgi:uncharacterized protein
MAEATRPVPHPTPESKHFWDGLAARRIMLQRCRDCQDFYFPPRDHCPKCGGGEIEVVEASGEATLYSFVVSNHRVPGFERPYVVAVAELAEGPRLMTQIVGVAAAPENLQVDMPLEPVFHDLEGAPTLLHFRPKGSQEAQP